MILTRRADLALPALGAGPAMIELVAGNIRYMFDKLTTAIEPIRAGRVRALAVTSTERHPQLPELPALRETMPELANDDVSTPFGMSLPGTTPPHIVAALNAEMRTLVDAPEASARFATMGGVPAASDPERFAAFVREEIAKWAEAIRRAGLLLDIS